jgi:[pyruvate, water dikinase]-phosphate phosphotransferase / [pyruvate, water dikinase] kinase
MTEDRVRTVYYVSDGTGITAEMLGHSLLVQFEAVRFRQIRMPFVDSVRKAREVLRNIHAARTAGTPRPILVTTVVNPEVVKVLHGADALLFDLFERFIGPLEAELGVKSTHMVGRSHGIVNNQSYMHRIEAVNFAMSHDDGVSDSDLENADVILVGVSRSGKTPTSLYLALQFGIKAANYPLIPEDFERMRLPEALYKYRKKLFGLSIAAERLHQIRHERRPDSRYSSLDNCRYEIDQAQKLMRREGIRWLDSTRKSIEEIAATIMQEARLNRQGF